MAHKDHAPRILGGRLKGRALAVAAGRLTRPLKVLARRSLFDILGDRVVGARVLDLFAGAGTVGLEAASRGAATVLLVENAPPARRALATSIESLGIADVATVDARDAESFVSAADAGTFDLIYLGPPYRMFGGVERSDLARILGGASRLVALDGTLVLERPAVTSAPTVPDLPEVDRRNYGETVLQFFTRPEVREPQAPETGGR